MELFNSVMDCSRKGCGHSRLKERYKEISPVHNVRKGVPPTIRLPEEDVKKPKP